MGTAPMWRLLATMSAPPTLAIVVMAMYSIVDRAFVGNAVGVDALSGLSAAFPAQLLAVGLGLLTGLGGMSVISRALGARNVALASRVIGSALAIIVPMYLVVAVVGLTQLQSLVNLTGASTETAIYTRQYLVIILPGSLLVMLSMTCNNFLMAEGRPAIAMLLMAGGAVINIALDALFVLVLGWGVSGAAAATVVSQGAAVGYMVWFYLSGRSALSINRDALCPGVGLIWQIITLGAPVCIIEVARSFIVVVINNILSGYANGDGYIALFGVINSVLELAAGAVYRCCTGLLAAGRLQLRSQTLRPGAPGHLAKLRWSRHRWRDPDWRDCGNVSLRHQNLRRSGSPACRGIIRFASSADRAAHRWRRIRELDHISGVGQSLAIGGVDHYAAGNLPPGALERDVRDAGRLGGVVVFPGNRHCRHVAGMRGVGNCVETRGTVGRSRPFQSGSRL